MNGLGTAFGNKDAKVAENAAAVNGLGTAFKVGAGNPTAPAPAPAPPKSALMALKASEAVGLLERAPEMFQAVAEAELTRPEKARRKSVLEALLGSELLSQHPATQEQLVEALRAIEITA